MRRKTTINTSFYNFKYLNNLGAVSSEKKKKKKETPTLIHIIFCLNDEQFPSFSTTKYKFAGNGVSLGCGMI